MKKIRIGVVFGGQSKEREISFAGGRTVYDNLNKALFETVPVFVDSFGNFAELDWQYIYKGTIRDFYPPVEFLPRSEFQLYAENLGDLSREEQLSLLGKIGKPLSIAELKLKIDIAFLCLHGPFGEDGRIQGLFEYYSIPYTGSGILPSSIGIDKAVQKELMVAMGFNSPGFLTIERGKWINGTNPVSYKMVREKIGFPCVVKPAGQGSSIGVSIIGDEGEQAFMKAVEKAFFTRWMDMSEWRSLRPEEKIQYVKGLTDIREGIGLPVVISEPESLHRPVFYSPDQLVDFLNGLKDEQGLVLESADGESCVLVEQFIEGKEFSCIVVEDDEGKGLALPPTEIRKGKELFDYRSKYLPGLSRKITPIDLPDAQIEAIRTECERLFHALRFDVYARIDGFLSADGKIFLNDPNTTSGMMPSSFFFHQAAEIGLNPSQFLTFIIRASLSSRRRQSMGNFKLDDLLMQLDQAIENDNRHSADKIRVAVILGGYSSERHISVESGRNVFEKLASSEKYQPFPVFLSGDAQQHRLHRIPINLLLKDNADDIREKIENFKVHDVIGRIISQARKITMKYAGGAHTFTPVPLSYTQLKSEADEVFIALHGRPGEDGAIQAMLERAGLPYNGSGTESSAVTIDKYRTNEILRQNGFHVAEHLLVMEEEWNSDRAGVEQVLKNRIHYPFIAKPVDDGCSSAVKKIKTFAEFEAFCKLIFRRQPELDAEAAKQLGVKPKEEFPQKRVILVEELITRKNADHFLEITGGMLTKYNADGELEYEVFEASEALADGEVLSLEEKFLAGQGQNITPARYARDSGQRQKVSDQVKETLMKAAKVLGVTGYCRIDAFVRVYNNGGVEVIFIEVNSLPGMTPATCIFHQAAINNYKPFEFIDRILDFGQKRMLLKA